MYVPIYSTYLIYLIKLLYLRNIILSLSVYLVLVTTTHKDKIELIFTTSYFSKIIEFTSSIVQCIDKYLPPLEMYSVSIIIIYYIFIYFQLS